VDKKETIENSLREALSIVLGRVNSVDRAEFNTRFQLLVDSAVARSSPVLGVETVRYQGILLYASLIFLSVPLFAVRTIKFGDAPITVDGHLLLFYSIFIAMISIVFVVKAYVDYERASFTGFGNAAAMMEAHHLVQIALLKRRIQSYFFLEFFDAVAKTYQRYTDADAKLSGNQAADPPSRMNALLIDRVAFGREAELAAELDRQDKLYGALNAELEADVVHFDQAALLIVNTGAAETDDEYKSYEQRPRGRLEKAYGEWLRPWLEARNQINDEHLDAILATAGDSPELKRLHSIAFVQEQAAKIQRVYVAFEVLAPLLFALAAIIYTYSLT